MQHEIDKANAEKCLITFLHDKVITLQRLGVDDCVCV